MVAWPGVVVTEGVSSRKGQGTFWYPLHYQLTYFGGRADRLDDEQVGRRGHSIKGDNWVHDWVEDDAIH